MRAQNSIGLLNKLFATFLPRRSQIQNILEVQRVRQRRNGMDAVECAVGKELAKEFYRLDEDPFRMKGGKMLRLTGKLTNCKAKKIVYIYSCYKRNSPFN